MRRRIAEENPRPSPWDLRNRRGGLIDLEFIVQYLVLRHGALSPQILRRATPEAIATLGEAGPLPSQAQRRVGAGARVFPKLLARPPLSPPRSPPPPSLPPA